MKRILKSKTVSTGLAMFSMFFGAGNVAFPLAIGQYAQDKNIYAVMGLFISAILVPFTGLVAMILFDGNYKEFFGRIGKIPGFLVAIFILCLIGPFGATPRCIALSYSTIDMFLPGISIWLFSFISCLIILIFTIKPTRILDILGYLLTPFLLISLGIIVVKGLLMAPAAPVSTVPSLTIFFAGLQEGYHTMDLIGAFFFSYMVIFCLQEDLHPSMKQDYRLITKLAFKASAIGAFLLGIIYVGFSFVAALYSEQLEGVSKDLLLGTVALDILGPYAGVIACLAVALACLTTAIALVTVFAEFLYHDIFKQKIHYFFCLLLTLVTTFFMSTLNFTGIITLIGPVLLICYPALILLSVLNIMYKLFNFQPVKTPFYVVFVLSVLSYVYG